MLTFREYGSQMIGERLDKMLSLVDRVRVGDDVEAIHDMRVASRRLRAAFSVFAPAFPYRRYEEMEQEVRNITQALSEARELDVLMGDIRALMAKLPGKQRCALDRLNGKIEERRRELDPVVHAALARLEAIDLRDDLSFIANRVPEETGIHRTLEEQFLEVLSKRVKRLELLGVYVKDPTRVLELHEMRIAAKKLRYSMELFAPFRDKWFSAAIERVRLLQEALGEIHDIDVMIPRLLSHARRELKEGVHKDGLHAYIVDLDGITGVIQACRLKRTDRDGAYARLVQEWDSVKATDLLKRITERSAEDEILDSRIRGNDGRDDRADGRDAQRAEEPGVRGNDIAEAKQA